MRSRPPKAAAIYARISYDPTGERLGVQRQEADCRAEAIRRGWAVADVYVDDDRSAYDTTKPRPEYERLLRDIALGLRDGVMIWRLDRLHRQPRELEEFIVACDKQDVALATVTGEVDLATSQGRLLARAWGAFAAHEIEVRSERLGRAYEERARRGSLPAAGGRLYGYTLGTMHIKPREAAAVREAAARVLAGESLRAISVDLNRRGIFTTTNRPWRASSLRSLLLSQRLAGISTYHGKAVGTGAWKGILTRRQSDRVRLLLQDPGRLRVTDSPRWYELKGVLRCGRCGAVLTGLATRGKRVYRCRRAPGERGCGRLSASAEQLERAVFDRALARLDSTALGEALDREKLRRSQWIKASADLKAAQRKLTALAEEYARDRLTKVEWSAARSVLRGRLEQSQRALRWDQAESILCEFTGRSDRLRAAWPAMGADQRRAIIRALAEHVIVSPARSTSADVGERLRVWWHGEDGPPRLRPSDRRGIAERRAAGGYTRCSITGCSNAYTSNGLCNMHLKRVETRGSPGDVARRHAPRYRGKLCIELNCPRPAESRERCSNHYQQLRRQEFCLRPTRRAGTRRDLQEGTSCAAKQVRGRGDNAA